MTYLAESEGTAEAISDVERNIPRGRVQSHMAATFPTLSLMSLTLHSKSELHRRRRSLGQVGAARERQPLTSLATQSRE